MPSKKKLREQLRSTQYSLEGAKERASRQAVFITDVSHFLRDLGTRGPLLLPSQQDRLRDLRDQAREFQTYSTTSTEMLIHGQDHHTHLHVDMQPKGMCPFASETGWCAGHDRSGWHSTDGRTLINLTRGRKVDAFIVDDPIPPKPGTNAWALQQLANRESADRMWDGIRVPLLRADLWQTASSRHRYGL